MTFIGNPARAALLCSLFLAWLNLLMTRRWADVPGALHGARLPWVTAALVVVSLLAWRTRTAGFRTGLFPRLFAAAAVAHLLVAFFTWFPLSSWTMVPFLDDWPPRFQSTVDALRQMRQGVFTGWRWSMLGGYPISTDVTQDLALWAALPMAVFGAEVGFHATHLVLFLALPALVRLDLKVAGEAADVRWVATGFAAVFAASYSYILMRSGDTNSLAGAVSALASLVAAHAARRGSRSAAVALILALLATNLSHRGFFLYALVFLTLDAVLARDWRAGVRLAIASATAILASLPRTWDLWLYPDYYILNNVEPYAKPLVPGDFLRQIYYNVEILFLPGRWVNDTSGLTFIMLPIVAYAAWRAPGRIRFYALAILGVVVMTRFNHSAFAYALIRPLHLLPVFLGPVLAWFCVRSTGGRTAALSFAAFVVLYTQVWFVKVPHVRDIREFNPALIARIAASDGHLVALENAFHRDVDVDPNRVSLPTPFGVHYEALIPEATGRRLYAGMWDGWQWTPYRTQVLANGTFRGVAIEDVPADAFVAEMQRWGVKHVFVWSGKTRAYLSSVPGLLSRWSDETWEHFEVRDADGRAVACASGTGRLDPLDPFGATVTLESSRAGEQVTVRMNYHPAWRAEFNDTSLPLREVNGQIAFESPVDGNAQVRLVYPRPAWAIVVALIASLAGSLTMMIGFTGSGRPRSVSTA
jgi:hypothetical protein